MAARGIDLLLCHNLANICYLSGFQTLGSYGYGHYALLVPGQGEPILFASDFESHNAGIGSYVSEIVTYGVQLGGSAGPVAALAELLQDRGWAQGSIGYETSHYAMTLGEFANLSERLPDAAWIESTDLVDRVKVIKSAEEIDVMRRAADLTTAGMNAAIGACRAGRCDNDVAAAAYQSIISGGGEYFSLQPIVTSGRRSGIPHSTFRRTPLATGDVVFIEISATIERYAAPSLRCVSLGQPSAELKRAYDACHAGVQCLMQMIAPGAEGRVVAMEAGRRLRAIAPDMTWHGYYGYSVGLNFPPACSDCVTGICTITEGGELPLQAGMMFHCSVSLRQIGQYAATRGDTVLVTEDGCEALTRSPAGLHIV